VHRHITNYFRIRFGGLVAGASQNWVTHWLLYAIQAGFILVLH
jgi:hypothetical protein